MTGGIPTHEVRAILTDQTVTVYQAYSARIAEPALIEGTFVAPFKRTSHDVDQTLVPLDDVSLRLGNET